MDDSLTLAGDFPTPTEADWLAAVDAAIKGKPFERLRTPTEDGFDLEPLYTAASISVADDEHGLPGAAPFLRGPAGGSTAWDIRAEHAHPHLDRLNDAVLSDLDRGVTSILVRFDRHLRLGDTDGVAVDGAPIRTTDQLDRALDGVLLDLAPVALDAGHAGLGAARALLAVVERRGVDAASVRGALGVDPLAARASSGHAPGDAARLLEEAAVLAAEVDARYPEMSAVAVSSTPYVDAGAGAAQELGLVLASVAELLRAGDRAGVATGVMARRLEVTVAADADVFATVAKLRAIRWTLSRLAEISGVAEADRAVAVYARTADRMFSATDPWVNLLRGTAACFAAAVGGADGITVLPYDHALGVADRFGRRLARNTQIVLAEESHLGRVADPGGGSWYVEARTVALGEAAWAEMQRIEATGGALAGLRDGSIAAALAERHAARADRLATRRQPLTGVSEFPFLDEDPVPTETVDLAAVRAELPETVDLAAVRAELPEPGPHHVGSTPIGEPERGEPLPVYRLSDDFDRLRAAGEAHRRRTGTRPAVFLANLGPLAEHGTRTTFATNFLAAGGLAATGPEGPTREQLLDAFARSGATVACLCSSDDRYATEGAEAVAALRAHGATHVLVAGKVPVEGADGHVAVGTDVIEVCTRLHELLEVSP